MNLWKTLRKSEKSTAKALFLIKLINKLIENSENTENGKP